jgi:hypothetical protein
MLGAVAMTQRNEEAYRSYRKTGERAEKEKLSTKNIHWARLLEYQYLPSCGLNVTVVPL